jgi:riboflavin kinase/FMN adenylyltransferase
VRIVYGHEGIDALSPPVVMTIGTYDGLHLGHRAVIDAAVRSARERGGSSVVYSFYPPPWRSLGSAKVPYLILTWQDKVDLLHHLGVDVLVSQEFTDEVQHMSAREFVERVLLRRISPVEIHVGYDFHFGEGRQGDAALLRHLMPNVAVVQHPAVTVGTEVVGCTRIRELISIGRVGEAGALLGRDHFVRGVVVRGRQRGRTIGFPTANVDPSTELVPPPGVYAVRLQGGDGGGWLPGVANLGFRPTFAERDFSLEVHLLDWSGDLYGERVRVAFIDRLRDEQRFDGVDGLLRQIRLDASQARQRLGLG